MSDKPLREPREFWGAINEYGEPDFFNSLEDAKSTYLRTRIMHVREVTDEPSLGADLKKICENKLMEVCEKNQQLEAQLRSVGLKEIELRNLYEHVEKLEAQLREVVPIVEGLCEDVGFSPWRIDAEEWLAKIKKER